LLAQDGHDVVLVDNGAEAVAAVQVTTFDLVLMDMQMPIMDGIEATHRIRALESVVRNIPIVALSANAMGNQVANCRKAGMNGHLAKPIDRELLRQAIATATARSDNDRNVEGSSPAQARSEADIRVPGGELPALEVGPLLELFDGDRVAVANLLNAAITSIRTDLKRIENGAASNDGQTVIEAAHRLKGTSGSLRAKRLAEIGSLIQHMPLEDRWTIPPSLLGELRLAVDVLSAEIEAFATQTSSDEFHPAAHLKANHAAPR